MDDRPPHGHCCHARPEGHHDSSTQTRIGFRPADPRSPTATCMAHYRSVNSSRKPEITPLPRSVALPGATVRVPGKETHAPASDVTQSRRKQRTSCSLAWPVAKFIPRAAICYCRAVATWARPAPAWRRSAPFRLHSSCHLLLPCHRSLGHRRGKWHRRTARTVIRLSTGPEHLSLPQRYPWALVTAATVWKKPNARRKQPA